MIPLRELGISAPRNAPTEGILTQTEHMEEAIVIVRDNLLALPCKFLDMVSIFTIVNWQKIYSFKNDMIMPSKLRRMQREI